MVTRCLISFVMMTTPTYAAVQHLHMPRHIFFNPSRINKIGQVISTARGLSTFNAPSKKVRPIKTINTPGILWQGQLHLPSVACIAGSFRGLTTDGFVSSHFALPTASRIGTTHRVSVDDFTRPQMTRPTLSR